MSGYKIDEDTYIELLNQRIEGFGKQEEHEDYQIMDIRVAYDLDKLVICNNLIELDKKIIELASELSKVESDNDEEHWAWNLNLISAGKYPPDHFLNFHLPQAQSMLKSQA